MFIPIAMSLNTIAHFLGTILMVLFYTDVSTYGVVGSTTGLGSGTYLLPTSLPLTHGPIDSHVSSLAAHLATES